MSDGKIDLYNSEKRFKHQYELFEHKQINENNKKIIRLFLLKMQIDSLSWNRQLKYLLNLQKIEAIYNGEFNSITEESLTMLLIKINMLKPSVKETYQVMTKKLLLFLKKKELADIIKIKVYRKKLTPEQILTEDEMNTFINNAKDEKRRLIFSLAYESGMRPGEIIKLHRTKIIFDNIGAILIPDDKTGPRPVRIVRCADALKEFVDKSTEEYPLFIPIFRFELDMKQIAKKCGINKRVWPYLIRHTAATRDYGKISNLALKKRYGWTEGSIIPEKVYIHLSKDRMDSEILNNLYGIKTPDRINFI